MKQAYKTLPLIASLILAFGVGGCSKNKQPAAPAEGAAPQGQAAAPAPAPPSAETAAATPVELPNVNLSEAGLDELMAPIALYPDPVLAVMLETSKNPQEVMDAGNFLALEQNASLKDAALDQATKAAGFTPVAQALMHFGPVVDMMCTQFDWTKQLGAAYTADPKAVLASVQRLRAQAVDNGTLRSSPKMKVALKNDSGAQIVEISNPDPNTVNIPQYDPAQAYAPPAADVPPPVAAPPAPGQTVVVNNYPPQTTTVVQQPASSGVSTGTATLIGLLSFGAGLAVGSAIHHDDYYYPSWGYGGCYYGGRPYYPPPYRPYYGGYPGGYHGGGYYNRPAHYGNNNIYVNNSNNYYNRFNGNNNTKPGYNARPVQYNNRPGSVSSGSYGNRAGVNRGVTANNSAANLNNNNFRGQSTYKGAANRPANAANAGAGQLNRPAAGGVGGANNLQRPAGANTSDFKGKSAYQGGANRPANAANAGAGQLNRPAAGGAGGAANNLQRPNTGAQAGNMQRPNGGVGAANNMQRPNAGTGAASNMQRPAAGAPTNRAANAGGDRGFGQGGGARPSAPAANRQQPAARPQQASRPPSQPGGAFGGSSNARSDKQASSRGHQSMGAPSGGQRSAPSGGHQGGRKK
jgi:hypothetical protein